MKIISGESASVTTEMTAPLNETTLPTLLSNYKLQDIFNADEFDCSTSVYHLKLTTYLEKTVLEARTVK